MGISSVLTGTTVWTKVVTDHQKKNPLSANGCPASESLVPGGIEATHQGRK
jgi:hypothetical protein